MRGTTYLSRTEHLACAISEEEHQIWSFHLAWEQKVRAWLIPGNFSDPVGDSDFLIVQTIDIPRVVLLGLWDFAPVEIIVAVSRNLARKRKNTERMDDIADTLRV